MVFCMACQYHSINCEPFFLSLPEEKLNLDQSDWEDIHVVTGALKLFFRELPEPLVPFGFFTDIVETVSE